MFIHKYLKYANKNIQIGGFNDSNKDTFIQQYLENEFNLNGFKNLFANRYALDDINTKGFVLLNEYCAIEFSIKDNGQCGSTKIGSDENAMKSWNYKIDSQDVFKSNCWKVIHTIALLFKNEQQKFTIKDLIYYAGFRRYVTEVEKNGYENADNFGQLRTIYNGYENLTSSLSTPMTAEGNRIERASEFLQQIIPILKSRGEAEKVIKLGDLYYSYVGELGDKVYGIQLHDGNSENVLSSLSYMFKKYSYSEYIIYGNQNSDYIDKYLEQPYEKLFKTTNKTIQFLLIAEIHWWLCIKVPHKRGGGSIAEWICGGLMLGCNIPFIQFNSKYEVWLEAVTSTKNTFISNYIKYIDI